MTMTLEGTSRLTCLPRMPTPDMSAGVRPISSAARRWAMRRARSSGGSLELVAIDEADLAAAVATSRRHSEDEREEAPELAEFELPWALRSWDPDWLGAGASGLGLRRDADPLAPSATTASTKA